MPVHATVEQVLAPVVDPRRVVHEVLECPACHGVELEAVTTSYAANFRCVTCHRCWHFELGWVHPVNPRTCTGCRYRPTCLAELATSVRQTG